MSMSASLGTSAGTTSTNTKEVTVGYTLGDDDIGDNFTVNIKTDKVYSTPVLKRYQVHLHVRTKKNSTKR